MTLNTVDDERAPLNTVVAVTSRYFTEFCIAFGARYVKLVEGTPILSATEMYQRI